MGVIETFHEGRLSHIVIICTHYLHALFARIVCKIRHPGVNT